MVADIPQTWTDIASLVEPSDLYVVQNVGFPGDVIECIISDSAPAVSAKGQKLDQLREVYRISPPDGFTAFVRYVRNEGSQPYPSKVGYLAIESGYIAPLGGFPLSTLDGNKAVTVQPFTEVNSKLGTQYEAAFFNPSLAAGASSYLIMIVGAEPVLIKELQLQFNVDLIESSVYRSPTYSGGTEIAVYNLNDINPKPADVTIIGGATVTDSGVQIGPTITSIGTSNRGNRRTSSVNAKIGIERVLAPGQTYAFMIRNLNGIVARTSGVATWYQGPLSVDTAVS